MSKFKNNKEIILTLLNSNPIRYKCQDIFAFSQHFRNLLGFFIKESVIFDTYIVEASIEIIHEGKVFHLNHRLYTPDTITDYSPQEVFKILEDVDKLFSSLILAVLTRDCTTDN